MHDEQLKQLLATADSALSTQSASADAVLSGMKVRARRRSKQRIATIAGALCLACAIGYSILPKSRPETVTPAADDWREQVAQLQQRAEELESLAQQLKAARAMSELEMQLAANPAPASWADTFALYQEQAAGVAMCEAERLSQSESRLEEATAAYQSVLDLYPATTFAMVARDRLDQLQTNM